MELETIIGLEIHVQLKTKTKMFCDCNNNSEGITSNTNICELCTGQPGTLPVPNEEAVDMILGSGLALGSELPEFSQFARKHYFYPDLPKGYQISQFEEPFCVGGKLEIERKDGTTFEVDLERLHLEEDAGKLTHQAGRTGVDLNRAGTPLIECVTTPCIESPEDARAFLQEMKLTMQYLGVSDADMEKGHLRCDANISMRPKGEDKLYPKTEIKNLNSFKYVEKALEYEITRQTRLWEDEQPVDVDTTRYWDDVANKTEEMRTKEDAADYRYFPEPDIPPFTIDATRRSALARHLPELPGQRRRRFRDQLGLSVGDATVLVSDKDTANYFEQVLSELREWVSAFDVESEEKTDETKKLIKLATSWITTELFKLMKDADKGILDVQITPENMAELLAMLHERKLNSSAAQEVLITMFDNGGDPSQIVEEKGLEQVSDEGAIEKIVQEVIAEHSGPAEDFRNGKEKALQFLVGQVMKASKGAADPQLARELLQKALK